MRGPRSRGRAALMLGVVTILVVGFPLAAIAQTVPAPSEPPEATADPDAKAQAANAQTAPTETAAPLAGEIVVTARRRNESLQDVPGAVTAVGSEAIENLGATDLRALSGRIPNFKVEQGTTSSSASQIFLRGVGIDNTGFNTDPNVGVYIDDIFVGRLIGSSVSAVDLERIEILRGPQGTLYGRNSTAGAVKYVTRRPNLRDNEGRVSLTVGNFDRLTVRGSANIVLIPGELAVLLNGQSHEEEGYIKLLDSAGADTRRKGNGRDIQDLRAAVRYEPTNNLSIYATADYTHNRSGAQSLSPTNCAALGTRPGILANGTLGQISAGQFERCPLYYNDAYSSFVGPFAYNEPRYDSAGVAGTVSLDLGWATLKSITGYRGFTDVFASPLFAKPPPFVQVNLRNELRQRQFQQELQLASSGKETIGYIAGLFYYRERIRSLYQTQIGSTATVPYRNDDLQVANSFAAYGELYIRPLDRLEFTIGGRMSWDKKTVDRELFRTPPYTTPALTYNAKISGRQFTPKLGVSYDTGPVLLYGTYSKGYRAPGWANANPADLAGMALEFETETETSYEAGVRSQFFNRMLTLNASAFSARYNNLGATLTTNGQTIAVTADAKIKGFELEGSLRPVRGLNIFGNVALLKDEYAKPPAGQPYARRLKHAPRTNFLLGADYDISMPSVPGTFFIGGDVSYTSKAFRNVANTIDQQSDAYTLVTGRIGYRAEDDRWSLTLGGTNLTDKLYYLLGTQNQARSYQPGRRVFLRGEVKF
jgi:iron complex outermembrane recepter protein